MKKLVIIQTVTPDYRSIFFNNIHESLGKDFELFSGDFYFEKTVKSSRDIKRTEIKNHFFFNRKFLFQTGIWHLINKNDVIVMELNPRVLSNWIFLIYRNIFNKETVLWGHAWSRKGQFSNSEWLRSLMRNLADKIIVYTNEQKKELKVKMPNKLIFSAPNSVISSKKMVTNTEKISIKNIIYVGRLIKSKKPLFLIKSFQRSINKLDENTKLIIVGDGPEYNNLNDYIVINKLEDKVKLKGHLSSYAELKKLYLSSLFSISPGYIGLSVTQSFSFGVPMLVSKNEKHSPEIEAVNEGINALYFETDNLEDCSDKIVSLYKDKEKWIGLRKNILKECQENYSTEKMSQTFINLVK